MNKTIIRRLIKASAMQNMQGNWLRSFLLVLLSGVITIAITSFLPMRVPTQEELMGVTDSLNLLLLFVPREITARMIANVAVVFVLFIFVMAPFSVGIKRFHIAVARTGKGKLSDAFSVFMDMKLVMSSIWLNILVSVVVTFWGVLFMLLPMLLLVISAHLGFSVLVILAGILLIASLVLTVVWTSRYNFAYYILADGGKSAFSALRQCSKLMKVHTGECMTLRASYFLWDVISSRIPFMSFVYMSLFATVYAKYLDYMNGRLTFEEFKMPTDNAEAQNETAENSQSDDEKQTPHI